MASSSNGTRREEPHLPKQAPLAKNKIVFLGDSAVGKTSLIKHFMYDGTYQQEYTATIGIDFLSKTMFLDDRTVRLQLWDTAGQERFRSLIPSYIRDSAVAVIVFDITRRRTFDHVSIWVDDVRAERGDDVILLLVGNKTDIAEKRAVSVEEGESLAKELDAMFIETSAKAGYNVKPLFRMLATALPRAESAPVISDSNLIDLRLDRQPPGRSNGLGEEGCGC